MAIELPPPPASWDDVDFSTAVPGDLRPLTAIREAIFDRSVAAVAALVRPYSVTPARIPIRLEAVTSASDDLAGISSAILRLAPFFVNPDKRPETMNHLIGFPMRYTAADIYLSDRSVSIYPRDGLRVSDPEAVALYRRWLENCRYWLDRFRFVDITYAATYANRLTRTWKWGDSKDDGESWPASREPHYNENGSGGGGQSTPSPETLASRVGVFMTDPGPFKATGKGIRISYTASYYRSYLQYDRYLNEQVRYEFSYSTPSGISVANPAGIAAKTRIYGIPVVRPRIDDELQEATGSADDGRGVLVSTAGRYYHRVEEWWNGYRARFVTTAEGPSDAARYFDAQYEWNDWGQKTFENVNSDRTTEFDFLRYRFLHHDLCDGFGVAGDGGYREGPTVPPRGSSILPGLGPSAVVGPENPLATFEGIQNAAPMPGGVEVGVAPKGGANLDITFDIKTDLRIVADYNEGYRFKAADPAPDPTAPESENGNQ